MAIVEFALILPVLALILMGIVDLGRVFSTYEAVINAAREGARYCALHPGSSSGPGSQAQGELSGLLDAQVLPATCNAASGSNVTVTVTSTFTPITPLIRSLGGPFTVQASATMLVW